MKKPTAKRTAAMRKAFVKRFGPMESNLKPDATERAYRTAQFNMWLAFRAGAAWQRRQKGRK